MDNTIVISPTAYIATQISVQPLTINLGLNAFFNLFCLDDNNNVLRSLTNVEMTPDEYALWGTDDNYVYEWAKLKMGVRL